MSYISGIYILYPFKKIPKRYSAIISQPLQRKILFPLDGCNLQIIKLNLQYKSTNINYTSVDL